MTHNSRCEDADPKSRCRCTCGGRLHGRTHEDEKEHVGQDRSVNEHMGGELGAMITKLKGRKFHCLCRNNPVITITGFMAYPHDGGLADSEGNKWWMYITCPHCDYDWSFRKIDWRADVYDDEVKNHGNDDQRDS